jgi:hypothetical protein
LLIVTAGLLLVGCLAGVFDDASLTAVRSWVFNPSLREGVPQAEFGRESSVTFKLGVGDEYSEY